MSTIAMPRPKKSAPMKYGQHKKPYQFTITDDASQMIDEVADTLGVTRSEALEMAIRGGGMKAAIEFAAKKEGD